MDERRTVLRDGGLAVCGNEIVAVGTREAVAASHRAPRVIDAAGARGARAGVPRLRRPAGPRRGADLRLRGAVRRSLAESPTDRAGAGPPCAVHRVAGP